MLNNISHEKFFFEYPVCVFFVDICIVLNEREVWLNEQMVDIVIVGFHILHVFTDYRKRNNENINWI